MKSFRILLVLALLGLLSPSCRLFSKRPSVIIITLDTVRADHLSPYGYFRDTTPFLKIFSERSVTFNQAYTPIPLTLPAHLSLFSSHYPVQHRIDSNFKALAGWKYPLLPKILRMEKYQTCAVVASIVLSRNFGLNHGFQSYQDDNFEQTLNIHVKGDQIWEQKKRRSDEVVRRAETWLNQTDPGEPFFLWLHFWDAHTPYDLPPDFQRPFQDDDQFRKYLTDNFYLLPEDFPKVNEYDNSIRYLDQNLGKFFEYLRQQGIFDRALIIVTADHGEGLGQHKWYKHGKHLYQGTIHIPLLIKFPGNRFAGRKIDARVGTLDIAPTILDFLGLPDSLHAQGKSLMPLIEGKADQIRDCEYLQRRGYKQNPKDGFQDDWEPGKQFGVLCGDWKAIYSTAAQPELYNLKQDPFELRNLAEEQLAPFQQLKAKIDFYLSLEDKTLGNLKGISGDMKKQLHSLGYNQ